MADLTRSADIGRIHQVVPTRKIVRKRNRLNIRDQSPQKQKKNKQPPSDKKNHIDVYA